jgi:hypothetical protein
LPTFSHLLQPFQPLHPIPNVQNSRGAASLYNKNKEGKWYTPDFDSDIKEVQNPILGGSIGERFGSSVAVSNNAFVVGVPSFEFLKGRAVAYSYEPATNP